MKILMIAINDPAGTAVEFTKAINRHTEHSCRLITKEIRYNFMFEKDLHLPWLDASGWDEVGELLLTSDVFHFHMTADEYTALGPFVPVDYIKRKKIVHHHHGHPDFRGNPQKYRQKYKARRRRNLLVSTPDLLKLLPEARWQPNLVPIDAPLYTPLENKADAPIVICHSPTRKDLKNTAEFIAAVVDLKKKAPVDIDLRLIENTLHKTCLRLKRESHILFDHLQGYYGVSSLEGLSQGLAVVAGIDSWCRSHIREWTNIEDLPWVVSDRSFFTRCLRDLISDSSLLQAIGAKSREFMETHWNAPLVIEKLVGCYLE